ncbi:MAG: AraC family transcriptional regulator [Pseudomonadota bacterium]
MDQSLKIPEPAQAEAFSGWMEFDDRQLAIDDVTAETSMGQFQGTIGRKTVAPGFGAMASDLTALRKSRHEAVFPPHFVIKLAFQARDIRVGNGPAYRLTPGTALIAASFDSLALEGSFEAGVRYQEFFLMITPDASLDDELSNQVERRMRQTYIETFPVDASLLDRVQPLCGPIADPLVSGLLAESCALELLARSLAWGADPVGQSVSARDRRRMIGVRDAMIADPGRDHRLHALAREVGISVSGLKSKFQAVFGKSVVAYLRDIRLERAWQGIAKEGWTVSEAAFFVGYRHQSSFSAAFRRKFGIWPSALRQL